MSSPDFEHFLLTRFNVKASATSQPPSEAWLKSRLEMLRQFGLPSVRRQTAHLDYWLIFCDANSPEWFRHELQSLLRPKEEIVFVEGASSAGEFADAILQRSASKPFLITSRMDNDDALARDFVEMVQKCFEKQDREFINFIHGVQYKDGLFYRRIDPSNAFISLIERRTAEIPITVFIDWHNRLDKYAPIRRVSSHPAWLQHVHGGNIANVVRGLPVRPDAVLPFFADGIPARDRGSLGLWIDTFLVAPRLLLRVFSSAHRISWLAKSLSSVGLSRKR